MSQSLNDFTEETEWDRTILDGMMPLAKVSPGVDLDLRNGSQTIFMTTVISSRNDGREDVLREMLPLVFGTAWKILDLLVEFVLANDKRWTIEKKVDAIAAHDTAPVGLPKDVWDAIKLLYANTKELRHAVVHRKVQVGGSNELTGYDKGGGPLPRLSHCEQQAFCRLIGRLTDLVIANRPASRREVEELRSGLRFLQKHLPGVLLTPTPDFHVPLRVADDFSGPSIDIPRYWARIKHNHSERHYVDLELRLQDGRSIVIALEDAPQIIVNIDLSSLPPWARWG